MEVLATGLSQQIGQVVPNWLVFFGHGDKVGLRVDSAPGPNDGHFPPRGPGSGRFGTNTRIDWVGIYGRKCVLPSRNMLDGGKPINTKRPYPQTSPVRE